MNRQQHAVQLPHPSRTGTVTTGTCECGWLITYSWGGHGDAVSTACDHIEQAAHAQPVEAREMSGQITVMEGLSL